MNCGSAAQCGKNSIVNGGSLKALKCDLSSAGGNTVLHRKIWERFNGIKNVIPLLDPGQYVYLLLLYVNVLVMDKPRGTVIIEPHKYTLGFLMLNLINYLSLRNSHITL